MHALTTKLLGRNLGVSASVKCAQAGSSSHTRGLARVLFTTGLLQVHRCGRCAAAESRGEALSGSPVRLVRKLSQARRLDDLRNVNLPEADAVRQDACVTINTTDTTRLLECLDMALSK